jgi:hypothetical protein
MYRKINILFVITFVIFFLTIEVSLGQAIICEYYNTNDGSPQKPKGEFLEMIITEDNVSLIGYQLRDNAMSGNWQPAYTFNSHPLWSNLRSGTIIVIYFNDFVPNKDVDKSDGLLQVNLEDTQLFTFTGGNKNYSMNVAETGDLIALQNGSGGLVHCIGHTPSSGDVYDVFKNLPSQKVCHNTNMNTNQSVIVTPGGHINDYNTGAYGTKTELTYDPTPGFPNTSFCSDYWRSIREPDWMDAKFNAIRTHRIDSIELVWNPSKDDPTYAGYILLRTEGKGWTPEIVPLDGTKYSIGSMLGHAIVIDYIDDLTESEYLDENDINCDTDYYYFLYAYKFEDDPSKPEDAHGTSYNTTNYAASGKIRIDGPYSPEIYTENNEKSICEGDSVIIRLKNPGKYDDCTMFWIDDETLLTTETEDKLVVKSGGRYSIVVENEKGCPKFSNFVNLKLLMEPRVWFENEKGSKFSQDTTLFFCKDDLPVLNAESAVAYDSIVWYKDGDFFAKNEDNKQINSSGVYSLAAFDEECVGYSVDIAINIMNVRFRFSEDSLFFDADSDPVKKLIITNQDDSPLPIKKSDISMPPGFEITKPLSDEFIIPAKDFIEIEITFTSEDPVLVEGIFYFSAPCDANAEIKLTGRKKDNENAYPVLNIDELDFGVLPTCKSHTETIILSLAVDEYCLIKSFKANPDGFGVAFSKSLPYDLQEGDLEVSVVFNGVTEKIYNETIEIEYSIYDEDRTISFDVSGEKTKPILTLHDNSISFQFDIEGCDSYKDTTITVSNNQEYEIQIKDNFFVKHIKFTDLPQTIASGETKEIAVRLKSGTYPPASFKTQPCYMDIDKPIEVDISSVAPNLVFDLETDTLDFGLINSCDDLTYNATILLSSNGVKSKIYKIENFNSHFFTTGVSAGDSLHKIEELGVTFEGSYEGKYLDSIVCMIEPCEVRKIVYLKAETFEPSPPIIDRDTIDFGIIEVGSKSIPIGVLIDNSELDGERLTVLDFANLKPPFFMVNGELPYELAHGASVDYFFDYAPNKESDLDTCTIFVSYDSSCDYIQKIFLKGAAYSAKLQSKVEIKVDSITEATVNRREDVNVYISRLNDVKFEDCSIKSMQTVFEYDSSVIYVQEVMKSKLNEKAIENLKWQEISPSRIRVDLTMSDTEILHEGELVNISFLPLLSDSMFTKFSPIETVIVSDTAEFELIEINGEIKVKPVCDLGEKNIVFRSDMNMIELDESRVNEMKVTIYIHQSSLTNVRLYSLTGQMVSEVCSDFLECGVYNYQLEVGNLPRGCYFLQFDAKNTNETYKILLK